MFIANKNVRNKQSISDAIDMSEGTLGESNNNEENDGSNTSSSIHNTDYDEATDNKVENSEIQNVIGQDSVEVGTINDNTNKTDIWLLSVSAIFLLLTIIFSIIYIKHQQKPKKKVSK